MKIHLEQIKARDKFHGKSSGFVDSGFVKTCDDLVLGNTKNSQVHQMSGHMASPFGKYSLMVIVHIPEYVMKRMYG